MLLSFILIEFSCDYEYLCFKSFSATMLADFWDFLFSSKNFKFMFVKTDFSFTVPKI
jgi:hypothetical protein